MKVVTTYLSTGVNLVKKCMDWNKDLNLIAFASCNRIIIYDPNICKITGISNDIHGSCITSLQWVHQEGHENRKCQSAYIISTSTNGTAKLWQLKDSSISNCIDCSISTLTCLIDDSSLGSLGTGCAILLPPVNLTDASKILTVVSGYDHSILGWTVDTCTGEILASIRYKLSGRSLALALLLIPTSSLLSSHSYPLLVYGGDDGKIQILSSADGVDYQLNCFLAGHQDWLTTLDYTFDKNGDILICSGSKDGLIRLWRLSVTEKVSNNDNNDILKLQEVKIKIPLIDSQKHGTRNIYCSLESVLHAHDGLVSHLNWNIQSTEIEEDLQLLSCSKTDDCSIIVWEANSEQSEGVWTEKARLGEVGGNREGFFVAQFGQTTKQIAAISYQGGLHLWLNVDGFWQPQSAISGHFSDVVDLDWDLDGRYLLTVSKDQTTRLHALCVKQKLQSYWQEIARPQVHGYDMACIAQIGKYKFVSGAEEKVIRGFTATAAFVRNLKDISNLNIDSDKDAINMPQTASMPSLGLSNKAEECVLIQSDNNEKSVSNRNSTSVALPTEDKLMLGTLWPEISKLYGHGNELLSLAATSDGLILASACRATNYVDAKIIIWNTDEWIEIQSLMHHRLSVVQMTFSSCDQFILSVSRDRSWAIFEKRQNGFELTFHSGQINKKLNHSRIIWSCCWIPNSLMFITGSRDKTIAIWYPKRNLKNGQEWERIFVHEEPEEITAISATRISQNIAIIAIGCVNGRLSILKYDSLENRILSTEKILVTHVNTIRRLKFNSSSQDCIRLASCGNDNAVFVYDIVV